MENLLFKKAAKILISLGDNSKSWFVSNLAKANNATFVYTSKIVNKFAKMGWVKAEKKGRKKEVNLTNEGKEIVAALSSALSKITTKETAEKGKSEQKPPEDNTNANKDKIQQITPPPVIGAVQNSKKPKDSEAS